MQNVITLLQSAHAVIDKTVNLISFTTTGTTHVLNVDDVKYAQVGYYVTINGDDFRISAFDAELNTITVTGTGTPITGDFDLYDVYFFHGTPRETATEMQKAEDNRDNTPMIWVNEIFDEQHDFDETSAIECTASPRIFALGGRTEEFSKDLKEGYIDPMRRLMELFIDAMKTLTGTFDMTEYKAKITSYPKFGIYISNKGVDANLFPMPLSGVENQSDIIIYKQFDC